MELEARGVPTTALFTEAFAELARAVCAGKGAPGLARVVFPHPLNDRPEDFVRAAVRERVPQIVAGLGVGGPRPARQEGA